MATMTISKLVTTLEALKKFYGDVPVVLWDLDSHSYFSLAEANIEAQRMGDGSVRLSVGPNEWDDPSEDEPAKRPLE